MIYFLLFPVRLFSCTFFIGFDQKCLLEEKASILNCTQKFIDHDRNWILARLVISILSSFLYLFIIFWNYERLNYKTALLKKLWRKGYFWSLIFYLVLTCTYYVLQFNGSAVSVLLFIWLPVLVLVVSCLNFLPPVSVPQAYDRNVETVST